MGLQRSGYSHEDIGALKVAFMKLFSRRARMNGTAIRDRVEAILTGEVLNPCVRNLCTFLMRSFAHGRHGRYLESLRNDAVHRDTWKPRVEPALTVDVVGKGSVARNPCRADGDPHEVVELTATAEPGWCFAGWEGGLSGRGNPKIVTLDRDQAVSATFLQTH